MTAQPEPRWWRRSRDLALRAARQAKAEAAVALLELDTAQRSAASHVEFLAGVDAGPTGARLRTAWAPVSEQADDAVRAYLEATAHRDVDTDLELEEAAAAATAFRGHSEAMGAAVAQISAFSARSHQDFVKVTQTLEQLAAQRSTTEAAVQAALEVVEKAEAGGLRCDRGRELLREAGERFEVVVAGPARHGMGDVLQACQDVVSLSSAATAAVRELPRLRQQVHTRTASLSTRLSALAWRSEQGDEETMRRLRREFSRECSEDLEGAATRAADGLDRARTALAAATRAAEEQVWETALAAVGEARSSLDGVQAEVEGPRERLAMLQAVAADPGAAAAHARFVVRDVRKLLMAGPVTDRHGRELDRLAARLEATADLLERPHPDWLTYAHTLDAIVDSARGLVVDIRASRAR